MTLYLETTTLEIKVPLKIIQQDIGDVLDPLFNREKIGDRPIMNAEMDNEENSDLNHQDIHVIKLTKDWIKQPFKLDPISQAIVFHTQADPTRG